MDYNPQGDEYSGGGTLLNAEFAKSYTYDVFMQYTGLKDKNGKEVYEGDIFKTNNLAVGEVLWDTDQFVARIEDDRWHGIRDESLGYAVSMDIQVIGNIYENPELLEKRD